MSAGFLKVLNISITAGWLVLAVIMLRFALKKAPKWIRCMLWAVVALRLMLPFTIESSFSLLPSAEPIRTEAAAAAVQAVPQEPSAVREHVVLRSGFTSVDNAVNPVMARAAEYMAETGADVLAAVRAAAPWIWIVGVGAMLLYSGFSFLYMKHQVRASFEAEPGVYVCDEVHSPFILGVIRPKIYLPSGLDGQSRLNVLAHERAHIKRLDHLWKPLGFLLLSIHWFNPMIWAAFILLSRDIEFACDEKVIAQLDAEGKAAYSGTLLAVSRRRRAIAACPVAFGEVGVKERIRSVLCYKKSALWSVLAALLAVAAVAACFLTSPKPMKAETAGMYAKAAPYVPSLPLPEKLQMLSIAKAAQQEREQEPEPDDMQVPISVNLRMWVDPRCDTAE